jgi:hypothetical protein
MREGVRGRRKNGKEWDDTPSPECWISKTTHTRGFLETDELLILELAAIVQNFHQIRCKEKGKIKMDG